MPNEFSRRESSKEWLTVSNAADKSSNNGNTWYPGPVTVRCHLWLLAVQSPYCTKWMHFFVPCYHPTVPLKRHNSVFVFFSRARSFSHKVRLSPSSTFTSESTLTPATSTVSTPATSISFGSWLGAVWNGLLHHTPWLNCPSCLQLKQLFTFLEFSFPSTLPLAALTWLQLLTSHPT